MDNELRDAIKLADRYIRTREYGLAWKTLRPYRDHPDVEKRLIWLRKKHAQMKQGEAQPQAKRERSRLIWVAVGIGVIIVAVPLILSLVSSGSSQDAPQATSMESAATETAGPGTVPNPDAIVTENPNELTFQDAAKQQLAAFDGVDSIISLDIDVPADEAPLVYVEISVSPGNNTVSFVTNIMQTLNGILNVTQYSDFDVIVSDGQNSIEYIYDSQSSTWTTNQLTNAAPVTP